MQLPGRAHRHSTMVEDPASLGGPNDETWPDLTVQPAGPQLGHPAEPHRRHCACTVRHRLSCAAWLFMGGIESARTPTCLESPHECANRALRGISVMPTVTCALRLAVRLVSASVSHSEQIWTTESSRVDLSGRREVKAAQYSAAYEFTSSAIDSIGACANCTLTLALRYT